jgi:hypothetical protein
MILALGGARSGLTTFLHETLLSWALQYSPTELQLSLFGLGSSRDFELFAQRKLPHARVVGLEVDPELVVAALDSAAAEIARRLVFFQAAGVPRDGFPGYRRETGNPLPRLVLAIDNVGELFMRGDTLADHARHALAQISLDGPESGVHLLLTSHVDNDATPLLDALPSSSVTRVVLPCHDADARAVLGVGADDDLELPHDPGHLLMALVCGSTIAGRLTPTDAVDRAGALRQLRTHGSNDRGLREPQVVDGRVGAALEHAPIDQLRSRSNERDGESLGVWLGESVSQARPVDAHFERREGANLLIVAEDPAVGRGLMISALTTAALRSEQPLELHVIDFTGLETGFAQAVMALDPVAAVTMSRRRNLHEAIERVRNAVVNRQARPDNDTAPSLFVINGLEDAHDLEIGASHEPSTDGRWAGHLEQILHEGPRVGIHTVLWTAHRATLEHRLTRDAVRRFALRVVGPMDVASSNALIDSPQASTLRPTEALLYDEGRGRLERLRPYRASDPDWIASTATSVINLADDSGAPAAHT